MSYCIMRTEKRKMFDLTGLRRENNRDNETARDAFPNSDIDWNKTAENKFFVKSDDLIKSVKDEIAANVTGQSIRKDSVVCLDTLFTASPEFFDYLRAESEEFEKKYGTPADEKYKEVCDLYFSHCLDFLKKEYGHVINAVIHYDEKTPHMHVMHVPLIEKEVSVGRKKRKTGEPARREKQVRLSAKDLVGNRRQMSAAQDKFFENVGKKWGLERGNKRDPREQRKHLTVAEFKADSILERTERFIKDISSDVSVLSSRRSTVSEIAQAKNRLINKSTALAEEFGIKLNTEPMKAPVKSHVPVRSRS